MVAVIFVDLVYVTLLQKSFVDAKRDVNDDDGEFQTSGALQVDSAISAHLDAKKKFVGVEEPLNSSLVGSKAAQAQARFVVELTAKCRPYANFDTHESCEDLEFGIGRCKKGGLSLLHAAMIKEGPHADKSAIIRNLGMSNGQPLGWSLLYATWNSPYSSSWNHPPGIGWKPLHERGLYLMDDFLTAEQADEMANRFMTTHQRSSKTRSERYLACNYRRSTTSMLSTSGLSFDFHSKVASATGTQVHDFQTTQLTRYVEGDFYADHYDASICTHTTKVKDHPVVDGLKQYLESGQVLPTTCNSRSRRMGTLLVYLNGKDEYDGGATFFPKLNVGVKGKKGSAIFFHPTFPDLTVDPWMVHAAEMVTSGTKIVAQQWVEFPAD